MKTWLPLAIGCALVGAARADSPEAWKQMKAREVETLKRLGGKPKNDQCNGDRVMLLLPPPKLDLSPCRDSSVDERKACEQKARDELKMLRSNRTEKDETPLHVDSLTVEIAEQLRPPLGESLDVRGFRIEHSAQGRAVPQAAMASRRSSSARGSDGARVGSRARSAVPTCACVSISRVSPSSGSIDIHRDDMQHHLPIGPRLSVGLRARHRSPWRHIYPAPSPARYPVHSRFSAPAPAAALDSAADAALAPIRPSKVRRYARCHVRFCT